MSLDIQLDEHRDTITVEGITYAQDVFRELARFLPVGQPFAIVSRDGGVLGVKRLAAGGDALKPGHSWRDYGTHAGRNISWCSRCNALASTGDEPDTPCRGGR